MNILASRLLRVVLVVLLLGTVLVQVLLPVFASEEGKTFPEVAYLVRSILGGRILFIGCGQVALLVVWRLLSMVNGGVIFTRRALRWVTSSRPARRSPRFERRRLDPHARLRPRRRRTR